MSILTCPLPDTVTVSGKQYKVYTDFRVWLRLDEILNDKSKTSQDKIADIIINCFDKDKCHRIPPDLSETINALLLFYAVNKQRVKNNSNAQSEKTRVIDMSEDAPYIYAAFLAQYGIDLIDTPYLHWFKFSAMLSSLDDNSKLSKIMSYRQTDLTKIKDNDSKRIYRQLKELYSLSDNRTDEEREADMVSTITQMFRG